MFPARTQEAHAAHVLTAKGNPALTHCFGVKKACSLTENLNYFHCVTGYPPDIFERIVPLEMGLCFCVFRMFSECFQKHFIFNELNSAISQFPYKWADKTNSPQPVPANFSSRKRIGGKAHENLAFT